MTLLVYLRENAKWLATGALLTFLSSFGQTFFIAIFAGEIRHEFGLSHGQWGAIYTLGTFLSALVMIWAGALTDVFRVRLLGPAILVGLALSCLAMSVNHWAGGLVAIVFALRFFGQGMSSHTAAVAMSRWFDATRGRALAIAALGFSVGEALLPIAFVGLKGSFDWRVLWMFAAVACFAAIPLLMWFLRTERTPQAHAAESVSFGLGGRHWTRGEVLRHPLFWMLLPALLGPAAFGTAFLFHQVHLAEVKGWEHIELVRLFPMMTVLVVGFMLLAGWAIDKVGSVRILPFYLLPAVVAFLVYSLAETPWQIFFGLACYAATIGSQATVLTAFWAEIYGTAHIGAIKALGTAVMVLGSAIGPGLTGWLIDVGFGLEGQFLAISSYFACATAAMMIGISRAGALRKT